MGSLNDMARRCRLCLSLQNVTVNIFDENDNNELLAKILVCLPAQIHESNISNKICVTCVKKVDDFYQYWRVVATNNEFFFQSTNNNNVVTSMHCYSKRVPTSDFVPNEKGKMENGKDGDGVDGDVNGDGDKDNQDDDDDVIIIDHKAKDSVSSMDVDNVADNDVTIIDSSSCENNDVVFEIFPEPETTT